MITKMNYLLLSTMMVAAIDSTFGRGCDCCKKLCADKDSSEPSIKSENNKILNDELIKGNEKHNNDTNEEYKDKEKETLYFKIDKTAQDGVIKKCFNETWYEAGEGKVLLLQKVKENGSDVLKVTGSDNDLEITYSKENKFKDNACDSSKNKWIIVKVTTLNENLKDAGDSFIFYVDDINSFANDGVFEDIECYSIEIIAANTRSAQDMYGMFLRVKSALEQNKGKDTGPGLIGLEKLNVENVTTLRWTFYGAIYKQATLEQLKKWRFSGKNKVDIGYLFYSKVEGLNFRVLDDWSNAQKSKTVYFWRTNDCTSGQVFVWSGNKKDFNPPTWFDDIEEGK